MQMTLTITNNGDSSVRLGEFNTAGVRFLDPKVHVDETSVELIFDQGLGDVFSVRIAGDIIN